MKTKDAAVRTIADIAQLAGVSKSTVSRALNDSPLISAETKSRIQAIARESNFQIHQIARSLSLQRSQAVALVMAREKAGYFTTDSFDREVLGAVASALAVHGYDLLIAQIEVDDLGWPSRYLDSGRADGFILLTCTRHEDHIGALVARQAPFIVWGTPLPGYRYCSVTGDSLTGGRLATEHLVEQGRQQIAFLGGAKCEREVLLRYQGYRDALAAAGRSVDPDLVAYGNFTSQSGAEAMQQLLDQTPELDAVFVNSDLMAIAAMGTLRENGRRVPEDVAVVGYDDISLAAHCAPPLTTVRQDIPQIGRLLVETLMQYLETGAVTNVTMPAELVVRQSSGALA